MSWRAARSTQQKGRDLLSVSVGALVSPLLVRSASPSPAQRAAWVGKANEAATSLWIMSKENVTGTPVRGLFGYSFGNHLPIILWSLARHILPNGTWHALPSSLFLQSGWPMGCVGTVSPGHWGKREEYQLRRFWQAGFGFWARLQPGSVTWGNLRVWDPPKSDGKEECSVYWKPADLASLSMDIWPWTCSGNPLQPEEGSEHISALLRPQQKRGYLHFQFLQPSHCKDWPL